MRPRLHILLALALLTLNWAQLSHQSDLHSHEDNGSCELCLFAGSHHHGADPVVPVPVRSQAYLYYKPRAYRSPATVQPCLALPRLRGPPRLSPA